MLLFCLARTLFQISTKVKPNKKAQIPIKNWKIVKGDQVQIRSGVDKGKVGKVLKVYRKDNSVVVQGVNLRNKKFRSQNDTMVMKQMPSRVHVCRVGLYDPVSKGAVRVKYGYHPETFERLRISKKTGTIIPKPKRDELKRTERGKNRPKGVKDTSTDLAHKVTYQGQDFDKIKKQFEAFIAEKERREKNLVFNS